MLTQEVLSQNWKEVVILWEEEFETIRCCLWCAIRCVSLLSPECAYVSISTREGADLINP